MEQEFNKGDRVTWKSHGGNAEGEVLRKITEDTELAGRKVRASKDDPQYVVRSDKSGGEAVHKPSALRKKGDGDGHWNRKLNVAWRSTPHWLLRLRIRCT